MPEYRHARIEPAPRRRAYRIAAVLAASVAAVAALPLTMLTVESASAISIGSGDCVSTADAGLTAQVQSNHPYKPGGFTPVNGCVVVFTAGTGAWTVPAGVTKLFMQMIGGGGGGGNFGGGGGGEVVRREFDFPGQYIAVTPGAAISVTVGAGGSGGTAGTPATNGADSVFDSLTAKGGGGGGSTDSGTGIGAAGLAGAGGGGGAPNTTGNTGGAGGAATNAGCSGCVGGDGKGVTEGSAVYVGGGGGGGNNNGSIEKEGRSPSVGSGCVNNDGGTGSRLQLAEWLVPNTDNMSMGSGGGGGCAAYGTPVGAYARTANFRGGQYFFGVWYGNPESGAANTGQGGGGGADYGVTGGAGGSGLVAIWYVPGGGATGGPTVTPPSPVVADGTNPVVFDVPATITEGASPIDSGATCIVDPATLACGTQVTLPTQGTWVLDVGAGTLTFTAFPTATPGATESVVLRVTDTGGATAEGTFSVVIPDGSVRPGFTG